MSRVGSTLLRGLNEFSYAPVLTLVQAVCRTFLLLEDTGPPPPRDGGFLVVANHTSFVDPAVLQMAFGRRIRYLMTEDFYDLRSIGWFFRWMRTLRVSESGSNLTSLRIARNVLRQGDLVGLFPEGELSRDGTLGRARPGAAVLASLAGVPVLPVRIRGTYEVWRHGMLFPRPGRVSVTRGAPISAPTSGKASRRDFSRQIMDSIAAL